MKKTGSIPLFFACCILLPLSIYAVVNWYEVNKGRLPVYGEKTEGKPHTIAPFRMLDQEGRTVGLADWQGKIVVANFFFTHCPVICPKMTKGLIDVQKTFAADPQVAICSFTVDPERDNSKTLAAYAVRFSIDPKKWHLLTGDKKEIYRLARNSFQVVATEGDGSATDFIHSDKLVLIDTHQRIRGYYSGTESKDIQQLLTDIKKLKHEN